MDKITLKLAKKVLQVVDVGLVRGLGEPTPGKMCVEAAVCYAMNLPHSDRPTCVSDAVRDVKITLNDGDWSSNIARSKGMRRLAIAQLGSKGVVSDVEFSKALFDISVRKTCVRALRIAANVQLTDFYKNSLLEAANECEKFGTVGAARAAARAAEAAVEAAKAAEAAAWAAEAAGAVEAAKAAEAAAWAAWAARAARAAAEAAWAAEAAAWAAEAAAWAAAGAAEAARAAADDQLALFAEDVVQLLIKLKSPGCEYLYLTK